MSYCFSKIVQLSYEEAIAKVTAELQKEGFGILTEIDVKNKRPVAQSTLCRTELIIEYF